MVFESDNKPTTISRRGNYQQIQEDNNTEPAEAAVATRSYCKLSIDEYLLQ